MYEWLDNVLCKAVRGKTSMCRLIRLRFHIHSLALSGWRESHGVPSVGGTDTDCWRPVSSVYCVIFWVWGVYTHPETAGPPTSWFPDHTARSRFRHMLALCTVILNGPHWTSAAWTPTPLNPTLLLFVNKTGVHLTHFFFWREDDRAIWTWSLPFWC